MAAPLEDVLQHGFRDDAPRRGAHRQLVRSRSGSLGTCFEFAPRLGLGLRSVMLEETMLRRSLCVRDWNSRAVSTPGAAAASSCTPTAGGRTPGISCEAVPASMPSTGAGMRRHVHAGNHAAESFVSFIPLFGGAAAQLVRSCRSSSAADCHARAPMTHADGSAARTPATSQAAAVRSSIVASATTEQACASAARGATP